MFNLKLKKNEYVMFRYSTHKISEYYTKKKSSSRLRVMIKKRKKFNSKHCFKPLVSDETY